MAAYYAGQWTLLMGGNTMPDNGRCLMAAYYAGQWTLLDGGMLCRTMDVA